jgi:hypothetical protein
MGKMRSACRNFVGNLKGRDHSEDAGVYERIILKCKGWTGCILLRIGPMAGFVKTIMNLRIP